MSSHVVSGTVALALCILASAANAQIDVLTVDCTPFVSPNPATSFGPDNTMGMALQQVDTGGLFNVTEVTPAAFRAMTAAQLAVFDLIAINNNPSRIDCGSGLGLGTTWHSVIGVNSGGRVHLNSHDAPRFKIIVGPGTTPFSVVGVEPFGAEALVRQAALWAGSGTQTGLLIFNDSVGSNGVGVVPGVGWDNPELNLPAAWGISNVDQWDVVGAFVDGGYTDILPAFTGHPIYAGLSDARFGVQSISSFAANVVDDSYHSVFQSFNGAIFTPTEVVTNAGVVDVGGFNAVHGFGTNTPVPGPNGLAISLIRDEGLVPDSNHFKVYDVDDIPVNQVVVQLEDQFGAYDRTALWLDLFANPVDKNFEGISDVNEHQKWYFLPPAPVDRVFNVINQFGDEEWQTTDLTHLVVPSSKEGSPGPGWCAAPAASAGLPCVQHSDCDVTPGDGVCDGLRHFACYNAAGTHDPIIVQLEDQFGPEPDVQVLNPRYWCNPAQKTVWDCCNGDLDGDGLVAVSDLAILQGCLGLPPTGACAAADIDCDGLIALTDVVILQCQFATGLPDQSCCPGNSPEVYPIVDDINHLACYDIEPKVDHAPLMVTTRDQLDESDVAIRTNELLCVPSIKVIPEPGFLLQLGAGLAFLATVGRRRRKA